MRVWPRKEQKAMLAVPFRNRACLSLPSFVVLARQPLEYRLPDAEPG